MACPSGFEPLTYGLEGRLQIFKKQQVSQIFVSPCIKNNQLKHLINTSYYFLWRNTFDLKKSALKQEVEQPDRLEQAGIIGDKE